MTPTLGLVLMAAGLAVGASPLAEEKPPRDLTELSLAELANVEVTSVSKTAEQRSRTAAAVYVITQNDIRRSGATTIAEVLRLAPGVSVARIDSAHWSIGVRGFGDQFSKSVLVLIDGRSVYTPLFAGVAWAIQDTLIADIERVEVIRGPGGTVWGANAVNGVINIITKTAADTHGVLASASGGGVDRAIAELRYGAGNGKGFDYRGYAKAFTRGPEFHSDGQDFDDWKTAQLGGRADWTFASGDSLTVQGDAYKGEHGQSVALASLSPPGTSISYEPSDVAGANLRAEWRHKFKSGSQAQVQGYYDFTSLDAVQIKETRHTADLDFVHRFKLPGHQEVVWGLGARTSPSRFVQKNAAIDFIPRERNNSLYSGFAQDAFHLFSGKLVLTAGAKLEHNNYTGLEVLPNARVSWNVAGQHVLWAAVTRALRTPSRIEEDARLTFIGTAAPPVFLQVEGNRAFKPERLLGYEAGYRALLGSQVYVDIAAFHNEYDDLQSFGAVTVTLDALPPPPHATIHLPYANDISGATDGFEIAPDWKPLKNWQLRASYAYLNFDLKQKPGVTDALATLRLDEGSTPKHVVQVRSMLDLPNRLELDLAYRYVSALPARQVDSYQTADARLGWRVGKGVTLSLVGQNLLQPRHAEFGHDPPPTVLIKRTGYVQLSWVK